MRIKRIIGGNLESNGFIIFQKEGGDCYIIDPGYNGEAYLKKVKDLSLRLKGILLTHHHYDHVGGVQKIKNATDCPVSIHRCDSDLLKFQADIHLEDGEKLFLEEEEIQVIHTPGHTMGSVCFYSEKSKLVFTGDTIFNVDLGRTDLVDGDQQAMESSIVNIINEWGNDMTIYPGHGDSCNMKFVRKNNREFLDIVTPR
ncbi:MAG: MBL fold metallo-hydrolase [Anaerovorax sp.]